VKKIILELTKGEAIELLNVLEGDDLCYYDDLPNKDTRISVFLRGLKKLRAVLHKKP